MGDIWNQVATALNGEVDSELWKIRQTPVFQSMGSEIERALAAYFVLMLRVGAVPHAVANPPIEGCGFCLVPQYVVEGYRVDFVLSHSKVKFEARKSIVIECDGHDWHEKTKEQAARDKKRDRTLQRTFGAVLHFTGSEIYRDPSACMLDAIQAMSTLLDRHK